MLWIFDINETMLDLTALDPFFAKHLGSADARHRWFDLLIHQALVCAATGRYRDFGKLGAAALHHLAEAATIHLPDTAVPELVSAVRTLPAHPDTAQGLDALRHAGHRVVALGNSPKSTIDAQLHHSGLAAHLDDAYSAEQAGALKPARPPYDYVIEHERAERSETVMVAAHGWDIAGAQAAELHTVFVTRPGRFPLPAWPAPSAVVPDFNGLLDASSRLALHGRKAP